MNFIRAQISSLKRWKLIMNQSFWLQGCLCKQNQRWKIRWLSRTRYFCRLRQSFQNIFYIHWRKNILIERTVKLIEKNIQNLNIKTEENLNFEENITDWNKHSDTNENSLGIEISNKPGNKQIESERKYLINRKDQIEPIQVYCRIDLFTSLITIP